jgi:choline dehydrogenase-like flavoprotein
MLADPIQDGLARGWRVIDLAAASPRTLDADVCIVGTGAGGGVTAEILAKAGLNVVLVEEGPLKSSRDFRMKEADAYPELYQESAARKTSDKAINILQGRCVGGSTTVNWTSSFRTPDTTLQFWRDRLGLVEHSTESLRPWFDAMERRLSIAPWNVPPNENNALLARGAARLGLPSAPIRRNVAGCWNIGYCGMGCPTNAKQSMLVTTIPAALDRGATLVVNALAVRLAGIDIAGRRGPSHLDVTTRPGAAASPPSRMQIRATHFVLAAGAIGSPALLLRSHAPDPYATLGRRTFLHPTVISAALMPDPVHAHAGAPQTVYSDHFLDSLPIDGSIGFKLEAPPLHPVIFATTMSGFGEQHTSMMRDFNRTHVLLSLLRDGFHPESRGGTVVLRDDGSPILDYPLSEFVFDGMRRAFLAMAEIQFAAGARHAFPVHEQAQPYASWQQAKQAILALDLKPLSTRVVSAHVMGGCAMSAEARHGVVSEAGRHHQLSNVLVLDGSLFPTSLGANPQLSIYAIVARLASRLAADLTGREAPAII